MNPSTILNIISAWATERARYEAMKQEAIAHEILAERARLKAMGIDDARTVISTEYTRISQPVT